MKKKQDYEEEKTVSLESRMTRNKRESDIKEAEEKRETEQIQEKITAQPKQGGLSAAKKLAQVAQGKKPEQKPQPQQNQMTFNQGMYNGQVSNYGQIPGQPINIIVQVPESQNNTSNQQERQQMSDEEAKKVYEKYIAEEEADKRPTWKVVVDKVFHYVFNVLIIIGIVLLIKTFVITIVPLSGDSMQPTYNNKDKLLMEMVTYYTRDPKIDEIVYIKLKNGTNIVKRIVGVPGDTIQVINGDLYRNGEKIETEFEQMSNPGLAVNEITLGYDQYFVLGDNRNDSNDSRSAAVGVIDRGMIEGRIIYRLWPLNKAPKAKSESEAVQATVAS